jgi:hypothetical protein
MGELTTTKTQALGFSLLSFTWGLGIVTAPVIGGFLADPVTQFGPDSFLGRVPFVKEYPYLLPSLFSVMVSVTAFIGGFFLLPESEAWKKNNALRLASLNKSVSAKKSTKTKRNVPTGGGGKEADGAGINDNKIANNDVDDDDEDEVTAMISADEVSIDEKIMKTHDEGRPRNSTDEELNSEIELMHSKKPESTPIHHSSSPSSSSSSAAAAKNVSSKQVGTDSKRKGKGRIDASMHLNDDSIPSGPLLPSDAKLTDILKDKVVVSVVTAYTMLSFVQIVFDELLPVLQIVVVKGRSEHAIPLFARVPPTQLDPLSSLCDCVFYGVLPDRATAEASGWSWDSPAVRRRRWRPRSCWTASTSAARRGNCCRGCRNCRRGPEQVSTSDTPSPRSSACPSCP